MRYVISLVAVVLAVFLGLAPLTFAQAPPTWKQGQPSTMADWKLEKIEDNLDNPGEPKRVFDTLPKDVPHGWKYLAFGPDGKLYFNIGAPCNICLPPDTHAHLSRINPDGTGFEYVANGVRNSVGFDWHPVTKQLYFTTHGRDWLGDDSPSDRFDVVKQKGQHFGYPFCHAGEILDPEFG